MNENASTFLKKTKKFLLPLFLYNIAYGLIVQSLQPFGFTIGGDFTLYNLFIAPLISGHQFGYNLGGWFLIPLFMIEISNLLVRKVTRIFKHKIPEWIFFIGSLLLGVFGNLLAIKGCTSGWWLVLVRMLHFVPFFGLGIFFKTSAEKYINKIPSLWYFIAIFILKLAVVFICNRMPTYTASWCNDFTDGPLMPIVVGILGIAFWLRIATILEPAIGRNKYVNLLANNTYSIMINQLAAFMLVKGAFAVANKLTGVFSSFDWVAFKTNIWYYFVPRQFEYTLLLYVAAGLVLPIFWQCILNFIKHRYAKSRKKDN